MEEHFLLVILLNQLFVSLHFFLWFIFIMLFNFGIVLTIFVYVIVEFLCLSVFMQLGINARARVCSCMDTYIKYARIHMTAHICLFVCAHLCIYACV